jgi:predicted ATP-grasp superfamily ATP-dependent carboligase
VLVTDAGRGSAVSVIRSLGRDGIEVVAADSASFSPGFYTRFSREKFRYPPPRQEPAAAVDALVHAAGAHGVDLLIPVGDELVALLSANRERFRDVAVLALPDAAALEATRDKQKTVALAERVGVPAPRTVVVRTSEEAAREAHSFRWPIVLKPQSSRSVQREAIAAFGVAYANDPSTLVAQMRAFEGRCAVLLQEYCRGEGHGVGVLAKDGVPLLAFQHRRLREVPFTGGPSSLRESVALDPVLLDHSVRLLSALSWTGPAMVEFKVSDDRAELMEINGRIWGSLPLAVKSGVEIPRAIVDIFLSREPRATTRLGAYAVGVRSRDLRLELSWIASVLRRTRRYGFLPAPSRREAILAAAQLFDPRLGYDVLSHDDPVAGVVELLNVGGDVLRAVAGGGRRRR